MRLLQDPGEDRCRTRCYSRNTSRMDGPRETDPQRARDEQARVRAEFMKAFDQGLVCAGFERETEHSSYLLFDRHKVT